MKNILVQDFVLKIILIIYDILPDQCHIWWTQCHILVMNTCLYYYAHITTALEIKFIIPLVLNGCYKERCTCPEIILCYYDILPNQCHIWWTECHILLMNTCLFKPECKGLIPRRQQFIFWRKIFRQTNGCSSLNIQFRWMGSIVLDSFWYARDRGTIRSCIGIQ